MKSSLNIRADVLRLFRLAALIWLAIISTSLCSHACAGEQTDVGANANGSRETKADSLSEPVRSLIQAADAGDTAAMFNLGLHYFRGEGIAKDLSEAVRWYRKAADAGHLRAMFTLGSCYSKGEGVEKSMSECVRWYRKAAEGGYADAMFALGVRYEGVKASLRI